MKSLLLAFVFAFSSIASAHTKDKFNYHDEVFEITDIELIELNANLSFNIEDAIESALGPVVSPQTFIESVTVEGELVTMDAVFFLKHFGTVVDFKELSRLSESDDQLKNENGHHVFTLKNISNEKLTSRWTFDISRNSSSPAIFKVKKVTISAKNLRPF